MFVRTAGILAAVALATAIAPAAHAADIFAGRSCGMFALHDPAEPSPVRYRAGLKGGPVLIGNASGGTVSRTTMTCSIQLNATQHGSNAAGALTGETTHNVAVVAGMVTVDIGGIGQNVFVCTRLEWTSPKGTSTYLFDADATVDGTQCALARHVADPLDLHVAGQQLMRRGV